MGTKIWPESISNVAPTQLVAFSLNQKKKEGGPEIQVMSCFDWKRLCFAGFEPQNGWQRGSRCVLFLVLSFCILSTCFFQMLQMLTRSKTSPFSCPTAINHENPSSKTFHNTDSLHPQFFVAGPFLTQAGHFGVSAQWSCCWPWFHSWLLPSLLVACLKDQMDCQWPVDIDQDGWPGVGEALFGLDIGLMHRKFLTRMRPCKIFSGVFSLDGHEWKWNDNNSVSHCLETWY